MPSKFKRPGIFNLFRDTALIFFIKNYKFWLTGQIPGILNNIS